MHGRVVAYAGTLFSCQSINGKIDIGVKNLTRSKTTEISTDDKNGREQDTNK